MCLGCCCLHLRNSSNSPPHSFPKQRDMATSSSSAAAHLKSKLAYLFFRCREFLFSVLSGVCRRYCSPPKVLGLLETIRKVRQERLSVARFGDGEMRLILDGSLNFQHRDARLKKRLRECLRSREIMVCIPDIFNSLSAYTDLDAAWWTSYLEVYRCVWYLLTDKSLVYGNAFISRPYLPWRSKTDSEEVIRELMSIWSDRDIVVVEGKMSRLGVGNDLFARARTVGRILVPAKNAFDKYDEILSEALRQGPDSLFILAIGPTATVLALDLHRKGRWALDLGHIDLEYEMRLRGAPEMVAVPGKFSNEVFLKGKSASEVTGELSENDLESYREQILSDLS